MKLTTFFGVSSFLCLIPLGQCYSVQTRVAVGYIDGDPSLLTASEIDRYTDIDKGLTAIKDTKLSSCYIKEYDPMWNPDVRDKEEIMKNNPYEKVSDREDEYKLQRKAGYVITNMCKPVKIYWATVPPPPMLMPGAQGNSNMVPPPPIEQIGRNVPAVEQEPVPIDQLPQELQDMHQEDNRSPILIEPPKMAIAPGSQNLQEEIKTPPPLEIYQRMHMNDKENPPPLNAAIDGRMKEPPKMSDTGNMLMVPPPPKRGAPVALVDVPEVPPPLNLNESPKAPPPINSETGEEMLVPPAPIVNKPRLEQDTDDVRAPPPLDVWRRMLVAIKSSTLAPPLPDMRSPEMKPKADRPIVGGGQ